jgi:hypothetical protein
VQLAVVVAHIGELMVKLVTASVGAYLVVTNVLMLLAPLWPSHDLLAFNAFKPSLSQARHEPPYAADPHTPAPPSRAPPSHARNQARDAPPSADVVCRRGAWRVSTWPLSQALAPSTVDSVLGSAYVYALALVLVALTAAGTIVQVRARAARCGTPRRVMTHASRHVHRAPPRVRLERASVHRRRRAADVRLRRARSARGTRARARVGPESQGDEAERDTWLARGWQVRLLKAAQMRDADMKSLILE